MRQLFIYGPKAESTSPAECVCALWQMKIYWWVCVHVVPKAKDDSFFVCTVEWSQDEEFTPGTTTGWMEMLDLRKLETILSDLETGRRYYFRVCAGNCKGYGDFQNSTPASVIPSSKDECSLKIHHPN